MLYLFLKWIHVLLAITALGANITYGFWIARATRNPEAMSFTLRGIQLLDSRIANPAYGLLLVTGVAMVLVSGLSFTTPWIVVALVLFLITILVAAFGFTPTLRKQIELADSVGPQSPEFQAMTGRVRILGAALGVLVVSITFFMVMKPTLWS